MGTKNIGIVICSRLKSKRLPGKAHLLLEGRTVISHLVNQLLPTNLPIVVAVPQDELMEYMNDPTFPRSQNVLIQNSEHSEDPLARTYEMAKRFKFDYIIRITHDKIFIDQWSLLEAVKVALSEKADYLYTSNLIPGSNFEIISYPCLADAAMKYKNVEFISYAVRTTSHRTINFNRDNNEYTVKNVNLLLDYEDDFKLFQILFSRLGPNAYFKDVMRYINEHRWVVNINRKPLVTVYTCAYNSDEFLAKAMESVFGQTIFHQCEYVLIDDYSRDATFELMAEVSQGYDDIKVSYFRNGRNFGLATSSNIALSKAKGKYIIRLDSDDFFVNDRVLEEMVSKIQTSNDEILYPDNYFGTYDKIQKGKEAHHVGGALFNKNALNFIKFTEGLRGYEGYDLFLRAQDRLKIGYFDKPAFFYTKRTGSMSNAHPKFREKIKKEIEIRLKVKPTTNKRLDS